MKLENVKTVRDCQIYVEGVLNDFVGGISSKDETMNLLGKYTMHILNSKSILVKNFKDGKK